MDNLTEEKRSIEVLNKDIQELKEEIRKLQSIIHDNQNKIEQIIRSAIDNIVEGNNTNYLEPFRIESLEKILEIIKNKKALIKKEKDIGTKEGESFEKIKQYILIYIKNKRITENKVIYYYPEDISGPIGLPQTRYIYIVYISKDDDIYTYTTEDEIRDNGNIDVNKKTEVSKKDLNKIYDSITKGDIKDIEKEIEKIKINITE
jgi:hypothetical protein